MAPPIHQSESAKRVRTTLLCEGQTLPNSGGQCHKETKKKVHIFLPTLPRPRVFILFLGVQAQSQRLVGKLCFWELKDNMTRHYGSKRFPQKVNEDHDISKALGGVPIKAVKCRLCCVH